MPDWQNVNLNQIITVPQEIKDITEGTRSLIEPTVQFLEGVSAVLNVIKVFINDDGNPIAIAAREVQETILGLLNDLRNAGIYIYSDVPLPAGQAGNTRWGENCLGGFEGFRNRVITKLIDPTDPNRPAFSKDASFTVFLININTGNYLQLISALGSLSALLGRSFLPRLDPPTNISAKAINKAWLDTFVNPISEKLYAPAILEEYPLIVNEKVGSLPAKTRIFTRDLIEIATEGEPDAIQIEWNAPDSFWPTAFIVERSQIRGGVAASKIDQANNPSFDKASTSIPDQDNTGAKIQRTEVATDMKGKVKTYYRDFRDNKGLPIPSSIVIASDPVAVFSNRYRFIDENIEVGKPYFYRVRAVFGDDEGILSTAASMITIPDASTQELRNTFLGRMLLELIGTLNEFKRAEGEPSEEVSAYLPNLEEREATIQIMDGASDRLQGTPYFGEPPNWMRVSVDNLFPIVGLLLRVLEDSVRKISTGSRSTASEIVALMDALQMKIDLLKRILTTIDTILALMESLSLPGFSVMAATAPTGGVSKIIEEISSAGNAPASSPEDFSVGIVILAGGPGSEHLQDALNFIFAPLNSQ